MRGNENFDEDEAGVKGGVTEREGQGVGTEAGGAGESGERV